MTMMLDHTQTPSARAFVRAFWLKRQHALFLGGMSNQTSQPLPCPAARRNQLLRPSDTAECPKMVKDKLSVEDASTYKGDSAVSSTASARSPEFQSTASAVASTDRCSSPSCSPRLLSVVEERRRWCEMNSTSEDQEDISGQRPTKSSRRRRRRCKGIKLQAAADLESLNDRSILAERRRAGYDQKDKAVATLSALGLLANPPSTSSDCTTPTVQSGASTIIPQSPSSTTSSVLSKVNWIGLEIDPLLEAAAPTRKYMPPHMRKKMEGVGTPHDASSYGQQLVSRQQQQQVMHPQQLPGGWQSGTMLVAVPCLFAPVSAESTRILLAADMSLPPGTAQGGSW